MNTSTNTLNNLASNYYLNTAVRILSACAIAIMLIIASAVYGAEVGALAIYVAFAAFYVQVPGMMFLRLLRIRVSHVSTALCLGFFTGWALVVAEYFISELIGTDIVLLIVGPVLSVWYIAARISEKRGCQRGWLGISTCTGRLRFNGISAAFCIFIVLVFFYAMASTQYLYQNPAVSVSTYMNPDKAFHMGLIDTLSHGWPMESVWVKGKFFKYHVFTELLMAVPVRLFGVATDVAIFSFNPILTTYVFGLSTYVFFREMLGKANRAGLCSLIVMLSNLFLVRSIHTSMAFHFAIINDNAVGYGISCAMLAIVIFRYWYDSYSYGESHWKLLMLLVALFMLLTGIKGPLAIVLIGAIWGTCFIGLILRKVPAKAILPVLLITAGFLFMYLVFLGGKGSSNGGGESIFAFATIANISFFHDGLILVTKGLGIPKIIRLVIMLVVFMIFFLTAFVLPFTIGYIRELILVFSGRKEYSFPKVMVYAAFLVGLVAMFFLNYSGHSQVYFGLVSVFFAPLITFWFFEDMEENRGMLMNIVRGIFIGCLVLTSITLVWHFKSMFDSAVYHSNPNNEYSTYLSISQPEHEAMVWLRENTPEDALIATDRYASVSPEDYSYEDRWANRFFLYATYANRFCYIAGSGYTVPDGGVEMRKQMIETNNRLYDADNASRGNLARELGVDYVVVSKRFNNCGNLENDDYKLCFSNEHVDIYKVN